MDEYIYSQTVHKDFHGIISYLFSYVRDHFGEESLTKFLEESSAYIYKPLIDRIKKNGLVEMQKHLEITFSKEKGDFDVKFNDKNLTFIVKKCPAISWMKDKKFKIDKEFCKCSTEIVNKIIAKESGYKFSLEYDQNKGKCIQKFWKELK